MSHGVDPHYEAENDYGLRFSSDHLMAIRSSYYYILSAYHGGDVAILP